MLKFSFDETLAEQPFDVHTNDRGEWALLADDRDNGIQSFTGYGGENTLTFHYMDMQDGSVDFVVVHSIVDSPARVAQRRVVFRGPDRRKTAMRYWLLNEAIASLIATVGAPDPLEEAA